MIDIKNIRDQFPILKTKVNGQPLIYFDNGATTQKPKIVIDEIAKYYIKENSNVHRGAHFLSRIATEKLELARETTKKFISAKYNHEIIFTKGTTDSINLVANGFRSLLKKGDEIIISELEHHANIVPWQICCESSGATLKVIPITEKGELNMESFYDLLSEKTKLVSVSHVSNTLGTINPVEEIISKSHQVGAKVMIDGAQAASHISLNMQTLNADFYAFGAHKMFGPTGVGVLYGKEKLLEFMPVYQSGGEMIKEVGLYKSTYADLPQKFEAGTPNICGIVGFKCALDFMSNVSVTNIAKHENDLLNFATRKLLQINGLKIYGEAKEKTGIISFNIDGIHHYDLGTIIDKMGVAIRTGHHCTQPIMKRFNISGTARISFAVYNTKEEIEKCIETIKKSIKMLL